MTQFNPLEASKNIKQSYVDYISTTFDIADRHYREELRTQLQQENFITKGPYLDISGSYQTGRSLRELMETGDASRRFEQLEPVDEKNRELKLDRPLYLHQEKALLRGNAGNDLVVTTGTGSGKTECFLIPIINSLLREQDENERQGKSPKLSAGVRAILIYPMNALANDQIKRMRQLLKHYPDITFGLYNGNTEHDESKARAQYHKLNEGQNPLPNELISRKKMQETAPHILITNYSMLEYMMLRPNDDKVFASAKLRFIVMDEAHIYKGTTGMETAMLMRRLRARIDMSVGSEADKVQFILTSATLGDENANGSIIDFAQSLCGTERFQPENIIRSKDATPTLTARIEYPVSLFSELANESRPVSAVLEQYGIQDPAPDAPDAEKLYQLLLQSRLFAELRIQTREPLTIQEARRRLKLSDREMTDFIAVCTRAELGNSSLIKARYHFFVRALEGAYITLDKPGRLFLERKEKTEDGHSVFEIAVCRDCGRIALVGREEEESGRFVQISHKLKNDPSKCDYFLLWNDVAEGAMDELFDEESADDEELEDLGENSYVICSKCGTIGTKADARFGAICGCEAPDYVPVKRVRRTQSKKEARCPACGYGSFRSFYLGSEAATAVLGTELYEQLPDQKVIAAPVSSAAPAKKTSSLFKKVKKAPKQIELPKEDKMRQFLCFSDSRSEAAFFSSYMENSYQEFLRRRGMWKVAKNLQEEGIYSVSVEDYVKHLTILFDQEHTFDEWDSNGRNHTSSGNPNSRINAWVAVLNELYNARRSTSLVSMGLLTYEYSKNDEILLDSDLSDEECRALLELLVLDGVYTGALDAGKKYKLTDAQREYIFFTAESRKKLVLQKTAANSKESYLYGWAGRKRENGNFYPNTKIRRLVDSIGCTEKEADDFLRDYWEDVFEAHRDAEFAIDICDFRIKLNSSPDVHTYRCQTCGKLTVHNVKGKCTSLRCGGMLKEIDPAADYQDNHYYKLYNSDQLKPLHIKEHTAQLSRNSQEAYQKAFVDKKINALSCSTTFEMGVDVGGLETVYMRDIPPSPSNYVQRAGRAGRASHTAAFVLTYAKLSSHDFTYYNDPATIISGKIKAPVFSLENEKVVRRHIYAVALSEFLAKNEDVYGGDDLNVLVNEDGYERLKEFLESPPERLQMLLKKSIPRSLHRRFGIDDGSWTEHLVGENGVLEIAVKDFQNRVVELEKLANKFHRERDAENEATARRELKMFRCGSEDLTPKGKRHKKSLIDFLARNNVLPKYGFPIDTVELQIGSRKEEDDQLRLSRDLQMAIAEYAPGAEIVADNKLYTSRYLRKDYSGNGWEYGCSATCKECSEPNFKRGQDARKQGADCISCGKKIPKVRWSLTIEPRLGFISEAAYKDVPLKRPEREYKTDDYYVGDLQHEVLDTFRFSINNTEIELRSTANDSLVVIGTGKHRICPLCGYATDDAGAFNIPHRNSRGFECNCKEAPTREYQLSHTFKTDVVQIKFFTPDAADYNVMVSVMYALLEGLSRHLGIERTDIKGCLHRCSWDGSGKLIYSIILYDAVPGGAGHVRRIVTEEGAVFSAVLKRAYDVVHSCTCQPSCYQCIRNYYNQKIHDELDRQKAANFLAEYLGSCEAVTEEIEAARETVMDAPSSDGALEVKGDDYAEGDYSSWSELAEAFFIQLTSWDSGAIPMNCLVYPEVSLNDVKLEPVFLWEQQKVMIFDEKPEDDAAWKELGALGWTCSLLNEDVAMLKSWLRAPVGV